MGAKLGTIFGIFIIFIAFMFGVDLVMMEYIYTDLDSMSINLNYLISKNGYITSEIKESYLSNYDVNVYPIESNNLNQSYKEGYLYGYVVEKSYNPIALMDEAIVLKIQRFTVINIFK